MENPGEQDLEREFVVVPFKRGSAGLYSPLSTVSHEIRILNISRDSEGRLQGTLEVVSLTEPGEYVALSYKWDDSDDTKAIRITSNGVDYLSFSATSNLYKGLGHLYRLSYRRIWADAICINRQDTEERSLQVRYMRLIYSKAIKVVACVGEVPRSKGEVISKTFRRLLLYEAALIEAEQDCVVLGRMAQESAQVQERIKKSEARKKAQAASLSDQEMRLLLKFFGQSYWN